MTYCSIPRSTVPGGIGPRFPNVKSSLSPGIFVPTPPMKSRFPGANVVCDEVHALLPPLILSFPAAREGKQANLAEGRVVVARRHFVLYPGVPISGL